MKLDGERKGVKVVRSPTLGISIQRDEIDKPLDDGTPSSLAHDATMDAVLKYAQQRMKNHTVANGKSLETLEPRWVAGAYIRMSTLLASHRCNVTVHGNLRVVTAPTFLLQILLGT